MQATVITHFFNEEYLLPWWLKHHKEIFTDGILIDYGSTDKSVEIIKSICPHWKVIPSKNAYFECDKVDQEVMWHETQISGWKIALNVTEFFLYNDSFLRELAYSEQLFVKSYSIVDTAEQLNTFPDPNVSLIEQRYHGFSYDEGFSHHGIPITMQRYFCRTMHRKKHGNYKSGRHFTYDGEKINEPFPYEAKVSKNAAIAWYGWAPFNKLFLDRKLQIQTKCSQEDINGGYNWHHINLTEQSLMEVFANGHLYITDLKTSLDSYKHTVGIKDYQPSINKICYNFMVSKAHHENRTIPLVNTVGRDIENSGDKYYLLGSQDAPDFPNLLKLSLDDTYYSLIEKMFKSMQYHALMNTPFDWFYIAADDTFVNVKKINELIGYIEAFVHSKEDLFIVGSTRNPDGTEFPKDDAVTIKGGSGVLMNRKTFYTLHEFCQRHNYEIMCHTYQQDATVDLIVRVYNSNCLHDESKQILYLNTYNMLGDADSLNDEDVWQYAAIHNHMYWGHVTGKTMKSMYELQSLSRKNFEQILYVRYSHFRSPSKFYYNKGPKK